MTLPSLVPFLVRTFLPMGVKFKLRMFWMRMASSRVVKSSWELTIMPRLENSRMYLTSRMSPTSSLPTRGPERVKATILRVLGSMMGVEVSAILPETWRERTGVLMILEEWISILLIII